MKVTIGNEQLVDGKIPNSLLNQNGITYLNLNGCSTLTALPAILPEGLTGLNFRDCTSLVNLPDNLPEGLTKLYLEGCKSLVNLPDNLPAGLTGLDLDGCTSLAKLPDNLPEGLTYFNLKGCKSLVNLPDNLPEGLTKLYLEGCKSLVNLPDNLPEGLTKLYLEGCKSLVNLPDNLPAGLTGLDLDGCTSLAKLPDNLPKGLTYLDLYGCTSLAKLPDNLPEGLTKLYLEGCKSLVNLPDNLPEGLTDLNLVGCTSLAKLPDNLPAGLIKIDLRGCKSLVNLPNNLPEGLTYLYLDGCTSLAKLPENLPAGLTRLNLQGCTNLQPTPESLRQLEEIEERGLNAQITLPDHWPSKEKWINEAKVKLATAIDASGIKNPAPHAIVNLFNRFTSEGLFARSLVEIISAAKPVIDLIEKDQKTHLPWMEEIALNNLSGCVNQPVQKWLEITGFVATYQEASMLDKIEASKQILARESLINFINYKIAPDKKPGAGIEVEFGNALMREVHKKLLKSSVIKKPWLGIPGDMAHEDYVERFLTDETVSRTYDYLMKEIMTKSPWEITDLALAREDDPEQPMLPFEHLRQSWMRSISYGNKDLSAKSQQIDGRYEGEKQYYQKEMQFLGFASDVNLDESDVLTQGIEESDLDLFIKRYQKEFQGNSEENADKIEKAQMEVGERYNSIESRKESEEIEAIKSGLELAVNASQNQDGGGAAVGGYDSDVDRGNLERNGGGAAVDTTPDTNAIALPVTANDTASVNPSPQRRRSILGRVADAIYSLIRRRSNTVAPLPNDQQAAEPATQPSPNPLGPTTQEREPNSPFLPG